MFACRAYLNKLSNQSKSFDLLVADLRIICYYSVMLHLWGKTLWLSGSQAISTNWCLLSLRLDAEVSVRHSGSEIASGDNIDRRW